MNNLELADKLQSAASNHYGDLCGMLWDAGAALRNLHTENMALRCTEMALRDTNAELERQPEEARKDAERYRQLRNGSNWPAVFASHDAPEPLRGEELDAAIYGTDDVRGWMMVRDDARAALAKAEGGEL